MPRMAAWRDVPDVPFACPDLTTFTRLDELAPEVTGNDSSQIALSSRAGSRLTSPGSGRSDPVVLAGRACGCPGREFGCQVPVLPCTTATGFEPSV